jgi:hypothetical protein
MPARKIDQGEVIRNRKTKVETLQLLQTIQAIEITSKITYYL